MRLAELDRARLDRQRGAFVLLRETQLRPWPLPARKAPARSGQPASAPVTLSDRIARTRHRIA